MNTQPHTNDGNEHKVSTADHELPVYGHRLDLTVTDTSEGAAEHDAFDGSEDSGKRPVPPDTSPLRVSFTVQYVDFGMELLYAELAVLKTAVERMRHIKRCLLDIVRCDFTRAPWELPALGECDRKSFKLHVRISARDTGLEPLYLELKPLGTVFKRSNHLRRRLYDAFTSTGTRPTNNSMVVSPTVLPEFTSLVLARPPDVPTPMSQYPEINAGDRRIAARKHSKSLFSKC